MSEHRFSFYGEKANLIALVLLKISCPVGQCSGGKKKRVTGMSQFARQDIFKLKKPALF
ncbi:MAG: hypothetical protein ABIO24_07295 [Saprospiraceae bacterium]